MPRIALDPKVIAAIIADLQLQPPMKGREIAKKHGVHPSTVGRFRERFAIGKAPLKQPTSPVGMPEGFRAKAVDVTLRALDLLTDEKLKKCSGPQLAVVAGILRDKIRDMDRGPESGGGSITVKFGTRRDMMAFLAGREPGEQGPPPIEAQAVTTPTTTGTQAEPPI